jgi:ABC-type lipoprotein release transport system permease subunit
LVGLALLGMFLSAWLSSRRLAGIKVVEALREL